ncbi:MAG: YbjN domain-containing protein [Halocynthiibacter sp.]
MAIAEDYMFSDDPHPIDLVENIAEYKDWDFDRIADNQISMLVEGQWRSYTLTLAFSPHEGLLKLVATYELDPPKEAEPRIYETLNAANDMMWTGAFNYWKAQKLMVYRYGLMLNDDYEATSDQVESMISTAITACERFYPALQLTAWADYSVEDAMKIAIDKTYGRA